MNTEITFEERTEALRRLSPIKFRLLELIVESMLRETEKKSQTGSVVIRD